MRLVLFRTDGVEKFFICKLNDHCRKETHDDEVHFITYSSNAIAKHHIRPAG